MSIVQATDAILELVTNIKQEPLTEAQYRTAMVTMMMGVFMLVGLLVLAVVSIVQHKENPPYHRQPPHKTRIIGAKAALCLNFQSSPS